MSRRDMPHPHRRPAPAAGEPRPPASTPPDLSAARVRIVAPAGPSPVAYAAAPSWPHAPPPAPPARPAVATVSRLPRRPLPHEGDADFADNRGDRIERLGISLDDADRIDRLDDADRLGRLGRMDDADRVDRIGRGNPAHLAEPPVRGNPDDRGDFASRAGRSGLADRAAPPWPGRVVVLADASDASDVALHRAAEIAAAHGAPLRLVCLADGAGPVPGADPLPRLRWKARRAARLHQLPIEVAGVPVQRPAELRDALRDAGIVVTRHRAARGPFAAWRVDPTAALVARLDMPVLVVKSPRNRPHVDVLAAVELRDQPDRVARWARLAAPRAPVTLLHVVAEPRPGKLRLGDVGRVGPLDPGLTQRLRRRAGDLRRVVRAIAEGDDAGRVTTLLAFGDDVVAETLLRQPPEDDRLLVVGRTVDTSPWVDALLGGVSRRLLRGWRGDVLVVPVHADVGCAEPVAGIAVDARRLDGTNG